MMQLTREQLEERLAAMHRASLNLIQDISLESLLERIGVEACRQANARYAVVGVLNENNEMDKVISMGMDNGRIARIPNVPGGDCITAALLRTRRRVHIENAALDPQCNEDAAMLDNGDVSFLGVPVKLGDRFLGQIFVGGKVGQQDFTTEDEQVLETLAAYAAAAVNNARLYEQLLRRERELTRRNENLALINELASTLTSSTDIDEILEQALTRMMNTLDLAVVEVYLRQGQSDRLNLVHHRSDVVPALWNQSQFVLGEGMVGRTAQLGQPHQAQLPDQNSQDFNPAFLERNCRQVACFPLTGRQRVLGVLCAASCQTKSLNELEMQFLAAMCAWMGTAIENVQLNIQQRRLAVLEERERIGMDLHDGIIQSIYAVGLILEHARLLLKDDPQKAYPRIEQAITDLNGTIRDIRSYILDLRPHQLSDENLLQGVQRLVSEFRANTLIEVSLQGPADGLAGLPKSQAVALFHICQEALANVAKHARAGHVEITLWATGGRALLEVRDDGRGFDQTQVKMALGHGLPNMKTRARNAGGDLEITSEPKNGTTILVWVPFGVQELL